MTGRELIIYILQNHLEDEPVFQNGKFVGFVTIEEASAKMGFGVETVRAMLNMGVLDGFTTPNTTYIPIEKAK